MNAKSLWQGAAAVGCALVLASPAIADEWNEKTIFTFSKSIELPGKTLPAGTYTFQLADVSSDRNIVQVFDKDGGRLLMTFLAVHAQRPKPSDEPMIMFAERSESAPAAVQYWYYPGRTIGHEFVYTRQQAQQIARATHKPVLAAEYGSNADEIKSSKVTSVSPEGRESAYNDGSRSDNMTSSRADSASSSGVQTGQSVEPARTRDGSSTRMAQNTASQPRPRSLPRTASSEKMLLLLAVSSALGLSSLFGVGRRF